MAWSLKKIFLPDSDTKLLAGWERSLETVGSIVREASLASARTRLTQAEAAGKGASVEYPWYFQIQGNLFMADGEKGASSGLWVLRPVNEVEPEEKTYTGGVKATLAAGVNSTMISTSIPARPYRRFFKAWGLAYGSVTGNVDLALKVGSAGATGEFALSRFDAGDAQSGAVFNAGYVEAGAVPFVALSVRGGSGGGTVQLASDGQLNRLIVEAVPASNL